MKKLFAALLVLVLLFSVTAFALPSYTGPWKISKKIDGAKICDENGVVFSSLKAGKKVEIIGWKILQHGGLFAEIEYKGNIGYTWVFNLEYAYDYRPAFYNVYH